MKFGSPKNIVSRRIENGEFKEDQVCFVTMPEMNNHPDPHYSQQPAYPIFP